MMQDKTLSIQLNNVGEDIGPDLGAKMVKDYQDIFPKENPWSFCGKDVLIKMLSQPDCQGIRIYNAINEKGEKTLVLVGINSNEEIIEKFTTVDSDGKMKSVRGIVADRVRQPGGAGTSNGSLEWWA